MAEVQADVVTPVADATPAPVSTADQVAVPEGETQPEAKPERTFTQKEVDEIAAKRAAQAERRALKIAKAEAERDYYKQIAERVQAPQPQPQGKPKFADFNGDAEAYMDALTDWKVDQKLTTRTQETTKQQKEQEATRQNVERAQYIRENVVAKGSEKYDDFETVALDENLPITHAMAAAIARLPAGHDVWYHLGQNPKEAARIARLPDVEQVWEIKSLESQITAPKKTTQAPAPLTPVSGNASGDKDPDKMTTDEWRKWREAQLRRKK